MSIWDCGGFTHVPGEWVTLKREHHTISREFHPSTRIAVLIGSLLRSPYPLRNIGDIIEKRPTIEWRLFVATAFGNMRAGCYKGLCGLSQLEAISFVDLKNASQSGEDRFATELGSRFGSWSSMRQWYKLAQAYKLMLDHEAVAGHQFNAVLKTRSDLRLSAPISLGLFAELPRLVVYGISDIIFFCNREVAASLLDSLLDRIYNLRGTENELLPLAYDRLVGSDLEDTDFFTLNYPCLPQAELGFARSLSRCGKFSHPTRRIPLALITKLKTLISNNLPDLQATHESIASRGKRRHNASLCSGAWWRNVSARTWAIRNGHARVLGDGKAVQSGKIWFYLVHSATPGVTWRRWPGGSPFHAHGVELHPDRHYFYCN